MLKRIAFAALLAGALVGLAVAQPPAGGRRGQGSQPPGPPRGTPMMFARGGPMMVLGLLRNPQVQEELKLTEEQRQKIEQLGDSLREKLRGLGQELRQLTPEEREKRLQAVNEEVEKELAKVLRKQQLTRLKQIALQVEGLAALGRTEVAKQVGINEEQQRKIQEILREAAEKRRALFQQGPPADPQATFQEMRKIREWVDEQISKLLTEQQRKRWQKLIGEPFKFEFQPFGPRGRGQRP